MNISLSHTLLFFLIICWHLLADLDAPCTQQLSGALLHEDPLSLLRSAGAQPIFTAKDSPQLSQLSAKRCGLVMAMQQ